MTTDATPLDKPCDSCGQPLFQGSHVTVYLLTVGIQRVSLAAPVGIVAKSPDQPAMVDLTLCERCGRRDPSPLNWAGMIHAATRS